MYQLRGILEIFDIIDFLKSDAPLAYKISIIGLGLAMSALGFWVQYKLRNRKKK